MHTCPTYVGFSGGAVFDTDGQVVAMNSGGDQMLREKYAVPYHTLKDFIDRGIESQKSDEIALKARYELTAQVSLGLLLVPLDKKIKELLFSGSIGKAQFANVFDGGVVVWDQVCGNRVGVGDIVLKKNDVITEVNNEPVHSLEMFRQMIEQPGHLELTVYRLTPDLKTESFSLSVKLEAKDCYLI
ncbi:unnamed protein product [Oppiella nova]|uniref:PDZ domain-containing protein n=1 Tax=Oppiella nova TaxID=334625 RepID=A0A7R9LI62_9ACAR|nr:unnamed protein product [Oppiella nova]CAG2163210.1 unnamed protein product [Oppiella nova]